MIEIDARGKACPLPLEMLITAYGENEEEKEFVIHTDNACAPKKIMDWITERGYGLSMVLNLDVYTITFAREKGG